MMIETMAMSSRSHQPMGARRSRLLRYSDTALAYRVRVAGGRSAGPRREGGALVVRSGEVARCR